MPACTCVRIARLAPKDSPSTATLATSGADARARKSNSPSIKQLQLLMIERIAPCNGIAVNVRLRYMKLGHGVFAFQH